MNVTLKVAPSAQSDAERGLADAFAKARAGLPGSAAIHDLRDGAFARFEAAGLPTRRVEDWKYTNLRTLMREAFPVADAPDEAALARAAEAIAAHVPDDAPRMVMVDGVYALSLSRVDVAGVSVSSVAGALTNGDGGVTALLERGVGDDSMIALNAAFASDGVIVDIAGGVTPDQPLYLVQVFTSATPASRATRSEIRIADGTKLTLVEFAIAADGATIYQANDYLAISVGANVRLDHVRMMAEGAGAQTVSSLAVTVGANAQVRTFNLTTGGAVSRYQGTIRIEGEGSHVETAGINLLRGKQHADTTLVMDHKVPNSTSHEHFHAVLDDASRSVFQGRIIVEPDAQKTDARMMTRALMLSDDAEVDSKPELEIFADDVQCGHGATVGALDESLLFYLRARGLPEHEAQALLVQAFIGEVVELIEDEALREMAMDAALRWLARREV